MAIYRPAGSQGTPEVYRSDDAGRPAVFGRHPWFDDQPNNFDQMPGNFDTPGES